jgi:DNA-binding NarL/FixJ family response regulator
LTPKETEILRRLKDGKPNKIIAYELDICESTVKVHMRQIMRKLSATNRTQAALIARQMFAEAA